MSATGRNARVVGLLAGIVVMASIPRVRANPLAVVDGEAVSVSADRLTIDVHKGTAQLEGNVRLQRGELVVKCARVEARYDGAPRVTWARATGDVRAQWRGVEARSKEAELWVGRKVLELKGGVKLVRGGAWMEAREAQIDLGSGRVGLDQVSGSIPVPSASAPPRGSGAVP